MIGRTNALGGGTKVYINGDKISDKVLSLDKRNGMLFHSISFKQVRSILSYKNDLCVALRDQMYKWDGSSWVTYGPAMGYQNSYGNFCVLGSTIHSLGGWSNDTQSAYHYTFNGSKWTKKSTNLPYKVIYPNSVVFNSQVHMLGGAYNSPTDSKKHYKYNGTSWSSVSTLPYNFYGYGVTVYNGELHILGNEYEASSRKHYKFNGSSWSSVGDTPYGTQYGMVALTVGGSVHVFGGMDTSGETSVLLNHYKWNGASWTKLDNLFRTVETGYTLQVAGVHDNKIYYKEDYNPHLYILDTDYYLDAPMGG